MYPKQPTQGRGEATQLDGTEEMSTTLKTSEK